ncbi:MAG: glycosyltransferase family 2 protein [Candidatus Jorgensenbacteria bacterium]
MKLSLNVIILSLNEEVNLPRCLESVVGWAGQVFIVDCGSSDRTVALAREAGATVVEHAFKNYVAQRNWALRNLPFKNEWVLFIDADEYPTEELKREITQVVNNGEVTPPASPYDKGRRWITPPYNKGGLGGVKGDISKDPRSNNLHASASTVNGYYVKRRFMFWGKWLKHGGYYPVWILRLMRHKAARCEGMLMDEHFAVEGATGRLAHDLVHDDRRGLRDWLEKHRRYAELKAREHLAGRSVEGPTGEDAASRERIAKRERWDRLPLFVRPFLYWGYRMFVQGGLLDGIPGIVYHTLHGFWYPFMIDCEIVCLRRKSHPS